MTTYTPVFELDKDLVPTFKSMVLDGAERLEQVVAKKHHGFSHNLVKSFINQMLSQSDKEDLFYPFSDENFYSDFKEWAYDEVLRLTNISKQALDFYLQNRLMTLESDAGFGTSKIGYIGICRAIFSDSYLLSSQYLQGEY